MNKYLNRIHLHCLIFALVLLSCLAQINKEFSVTFRSGTNAVLTCFNTTTIKKYSDHIYIEVSYGTNRDDTKSIVRWRYKDQAYNYLKDSYQGKFNFSTDGTLLIIRVKEADSGWYNCEPKSSKIEPTSYKTYLTVSNQEESTTEASGQIGNRLTNSKEEQATTSSQIASTPKPRTNDGSNAACSHVLIFLLVKFSMSQLI